jgi:DNA topoisomerase-1
MSKNLVIVESPAKAKTIEKFLGKDYVVASSFGHVADLPSKELGVNVDGDFKPKYIVSSDKKDVIKKLKALAKKAETVWLASDEDREGEAIAWHLFEQLKLKESDTKRIVFHEITKKAILAAVENPRSINYNLVNAQQARRVLDRLVGYELSPVLWRKVKSGLSAGRVQSVAVRLIVEKEHEIENFNSVASYKIDAEFTSEGGKRFKAKLSKGFKTQKEAENFLQSCVDVEFKIAELQIKPAKKSPAPPFTTSTLQQEASRKLYFPVAKTMSTAQRLYEAGLITYMRTDSFNLSSDAINAAQETIKSNYGESFSKPRKYTTKSKGAQEAHEAIRPTNMANSHVSIDYDQDRLYSLIWKRTIASQMSDAQLERTNVKISNNGSKEIFSANGEVIKFEGFLKVYIEGTDNGDSGEQAGILPKLHVDELINDNFITATERFTKPPYRFSEAALVKKLEELGIGRPSTYAPTISTIQRRNYVEKPIIEGVKRNYLQIVLQKGIIQEEKLTETVGADKAKLVPTDIGRVVNDFLVENFDRVMDYGFTAKAETEFDNIAEGKGNWIAVIKDFYQRFHTTVEDVTKNAERAKGERLLGQDPKTGKNVYSRIGRFGPMVQMGEATDEEKPKFSSLKPSQNIRNITLEEALDLFQLPKTLGVFEDKDVIVSNGRFGPYVKYESMYVSLPKGTDPIKVNLEEAVELIKAKQKADAPIAQYEKMPVQKGVGRFGPFLKWNGMFINVSKKYDFDSLSYDMIAEIIEIKKQKDIDKILLNWEEEGIRIEKARWGRFNIIKGKTKIELPKTTKVDKLTLEKVKEIIQKNIKTKKTTKRKTVKKK